MGARMGKAVHHRIPRPVRRVLREEARTWALIAVAWAVYAALKYLF